MNDLVKQIKCLLEDSESDITIVEISANPSDREKVDENAKARVPMELKETPKS